MITTLVLKCIRACNLRCPYCYYINEETENYGATISIECAKNLYSKFSSYLRKEQLGATLIWHGGEPLMLGRKRFQALLDAQAPYFKPGTVENCVQTNGVLINDAWAEFFERNKIRVGISLDGPADIHDRYRPKSKGRGTHSEVLQAMKLLTSRGISFGVIAVANPAADGTEVIRHFRDLGIGGCDLLLPMTNHALQRRSESAVDIPGLRRYLADSFQEWINGDEPGPKIRLFEAMILNALGVHRPFANAGGSEETFSRVAVVETNGDLCMDVEFGEIDRHGLGAEYRLGLNVNDDTFSFERAQEALSARISQKAWQRYLMTAGVVPCGACAAAPIPGQDTTTTALTITGVPIARLCMTSQRRFSTICTNMGTVRICLIRY